MTVFHFPTSFGKLSILKEDILATRALLHTDSVAGLFQDS